jgi:hypothetical protein
MLINGEYTNKLKDFEIRLVDLSLVDAELYAGRVCYTLDSYSRFEQKHMQAKV